MDKVTYTEYSERFSVTDDTEMAVTVQIPEDPDNEIHVIIQEPKLLKLTLLELNHINDVVTRALQEHGWVEEEVEEHGST